MTTSTDAQHSVVAKTGLLNYISAINQDSAALQRLRDSNTDFPVLRKAARTVSGHFASDMIKDKEGNEFLNILVGEKLSSVTFVMDYLQLDFDGNRFTLYVWPLVTIGGKEYQFGEPFYRDSICSLIAQEAKHISSKEQKYFTLKFALGDSLTVSLDPNNPELFGEIAHFTDTEGKWYVFD